MHDHHAANSTFTELRNMMSRGPLSLEEAMGIAEKQAHKFLSITNCHNPEEIMAAIEALPRIEIGTVSGLPTCGASDWVGGHWLILLNQDNSPTRQRFSLAHELKHILDHPYRHSIPTTPHSDGQQELVCNYFAGCLLIPRPWLKRAWTTHTQHLGELANYFAVSRQAMKVRLLQTGLIEPVGRRCRGQSSPEACR